MDKLNLQQGFVIAKHDYSFLQKSIENGLKNVLSAAADVVSFSQKGSIVAGFNLLVVSPTAIRLYNNNSVNLGYAVNTKSSIIKYTPSTSSGTVFNFTSANIYNNLSPETSTDYVCAVRLINKLATEDPVTQALNFTTPGRLSLITTIPGDSGGLYHDRIIEEMEFKFIPLSIYNSFSENEWVELGRFNTGPTLAEIVGGLSFDNVTYLSAVIRPNSVGLDKVTVEIQELLDLLFVTLDNPSYARNEYSGVLNKYLFTDKRRPLLLLNGSRELHYWEAELGVQEPVVVHQPDIVTGARLIKSVDSGNSIISITTSYTSPSVTQDFIINPSDNFNVQYPGGYTLVGFSIYVNSVSTVNPATDKLEFKFVDASDTVIFSGDKLLQNLTGNSWNTFAIPTTLINAFQWGQTYTIKFRCVSGAVSLLGSTISSIRYRLFHRPPAGQFGIQDNNFSLCIYDKYGRIDVFNSNRLAVTGIGRYIPYAADLSSMNSLPTSFIGYKDPHTNPVYKNHYVAIDVKTGRFAFDTTEYPPDHLEVFIYCNFKVKHNELNSVTLQRNSRDPFFKFENIESALERLSKITESYLLVKKQKSDLIPVSLPDDTYKTLTGDVQYVDSTGFNIPLLKGTVPESQFKIDAFYTGGSVISATYPLDIEVNPIAARKATSFITYTSGTITDGDSLEINGISYEFNTPGDPTITPGYIGVPIGGTPVATMENLASTINTSDPEVVATASGNEVKIEFKKYGSIYNFRSFKKLVGCSYLTLENWDKSVTNPLFFSGGRLGSEIEFTPRFANHQGVILFTGAIVSNPLVSLRVELYKGELGDTTNLVARCLIPSTQLIPNSSYFVLFTPTNVDPPGANYSVIPGQKYHYRISKTDTLGSVITIRKFAPIPFGFAIKEGILTSPSGVIQINHNLNDLNPFVTIISSSGEVILPSDITVFNPNRVDVDLSVFPSINNWRYSVISAEKLDSVFDLTFTASSLSPLGILTVNHSLNSNNILFVIYNHSNKVIIPDQTSISTSNTLNVDLSSYVTTSAITSTTTWRIRVVDFSSFSTHYQATPFYQHVTTFQNTSLTSSALVINHTGLYNNVHVKVYDDLGDQIYPDSIKILSPTSVKLDFSSFTPISGTWKAIIVSPVVNPTANPQNDYVKFQEIFEMSGGLATLPIGFDLYDDSGSLFKSSINRSVGVDNQYTAAIASSSTPMTSVHWQVQDEYHEGGDNFPPFTPSSLDSVFTASFRIFVTQWTHNTTSRLYWRVVDLIDNTVLGEFNSLIKDLKDKDGNYFSTSFSTSANIDDVSGAKELVLPTPIPSLSVAKNYRLEIKVDSATTDFYIATDGNPVAVDRKLWFSRYYSATFTTLPLDLVSPLWETLELPSPYYVAVDVVRGRYKFHPNAPLTLITKPVVQVDFYFKVPFPKLTSESLSRPNGQTVEDAFLEYRNFIISGVFFNWNFKLHIGSGSAQYPEAKIYSKGNERLKIKYTYDSYNNVTKREYYFSKNNGVSYGLIGEELLTYIPYLSNFYLDQTQWV